MKGTGLTQTHESPSHFVVEQIPYIVVASGQDRSPSAHARASAPLLSPGAHGKASCSCEGEAKKVLANSYRVAADSAGRDV